MRDGGHHVDSVAWRTFSGSCDFQASPLSAALHCAGIICAVYQTQFHLPDTLQGQK